MSHLLDQVLETASQVVAWNDHPSETVCNPADLLKTALREYLKEYPRTPAPGPQSVFLRPQEGDVCVLGYNSKITQENRDLMGKLWEIRMPGVKVVVVDDCSGVQSFRPAKGGEDVQP